MVLAAIVTPEGLQDGGSEIGAASHRLGEDDVGTFAGGEAGGGANEIRETAAETPADNLTRRETGGFGQPRVYELAALVVENDAHALSGSAQTRTRREQQGGFAGAQKSADQDEMRGQGQ